MPTRNTPKSPCHHWMIGKRIGRRIRNAAGNQSWWRWIFRCHWLPSHNRINLVGTGHPVNLEKLNQSGIVSMIWKGGAEREGQRERMRSP